MNPTFLQILTAGVAAALFAVNFVAGFVYLNFAAAPGRRCAAYWLAKLLYGVVFLLTILVADWYDNHFTRGHEGWGAIRILLVLACFAGFRLASIGMATFQRDAWRRLQATRLTYTQQWVRPLARGCARIYCLVLAPKRA